MAKFHPKAQNKEKLYPPCFYCQHLLQTGNLLDVNDPETSLTGWTCKAFPAGIPYQILRRYTSHKTPAAGQRGSYVFDSRRMETGGGETGWEFITFDGEYVEQPEEV